MMDIHCCPSTLSEGHSAFSPQAVKKMFNGHAVSYILPYDSPMDDHTATIAMNNVGRISLSGVQPKYSLVIDEEQKVLRYTSEGEQGTYMMKLAPTAYFRNLQDFPANEHLTMQIASQVFHIETAESAVCFFKNGHPAYITKRFDVAPDGSKYLQEDLAALAGITDQNGSDYKYSNLSYEECAELISAHVKAAQVEKLKFFRLIVFNFLFQNNDAHLKNFSLINRGQEYQLSPAYDLMNTSLHLSNYNNIFALDKGLFREGMNLSDTRWVERNDFLEFGRRLQLPEKLTDKILTDMCSQLDNVEPLIQHSFLSDGSKTAYWKGFRFRCSMLK